MTSYEYRQLLKFLYFEGYADSYENAEYLLEDMNDRDFEYLYEEVIVRQKIIKHLIDEGYVDTLETAEAIMVNMSEEWRQSIVEKHSTFGYSADDPLEDFHQFAKKGPKTNKQKRQAIKLKNQILSKKED